MIQAIPPDTANHAFHEGILPGATRRSKHLFDVQAFHPPMKLTSLNSIAIAQEVLRSRVPGKCFNDLLPGPLSGRMFRDIEVQDPAAVVG